LTDHDGILPVMETVMAIHELFSYICVKNAGKAIEFYRVAFGATEKFRLTEPSGRIGHAELLFGKDTLMLADEFPEMGFLAPAADSPRTFVIHLHVDNADETIASAVKAGAKLVRPAQDQFYGERSGTVRDPFGYDWMLGHSLEEVAPEEMQRRYDNLMKQSAS
jgi:PhnB protein